MNRIAQLVVLALLISSSARAEFLYGFGNISYNHLDWSEQTELDTGYQEDFGFIEVEGGAAYSWGELYGFYDVENFSETGDQIRVAYKGNANYKTGLGDLRLFGQHYAFHSSDLTISNSVAGFSYRMAGQGWFINPFIGVHGAIAHTDDVESFAGFNGGMAGWSALYSFKVLGQSFWLSSWNEVEFGRKEAYTDVTGEDYDAPSLNGAAGLWWNIIPSMTIGAQFRYSHNKLGYTEGQNAVIYSLRYNF